MYTFLTCTATEQEDTHARAASPQTRTNSPPVSNESIPQPGRAARSVLAWNNTSGVLFRDISLLTSRARAELEG